MRRRQNIIAFSAGESVRSGKIEYIQGQLEKNDIHCLDWRDLFCLAKDANRIALLPSLMKKIPTFDFALIFAEGVDQVTMRGGCEKYKAMRDNVIFELGMCIMALGADRVILLSEEGVRLPEDLLGIEDIGVAHITYSAAGFAQSVSQLSSVIEDRTQMLEEQLSTQIDSVISHINGNADIVSPVFVGAAVSSAEAYFTNFIVRLLENMGPVVFRKEGGEPLRLTAEPELRVVFPTTVDSMTASTISDYYRRTGAEAFVIENAGTRALSFWGVWKDGKLTILDIPTSVTASYSVVNSILNIDSDDTYDATAEERFVTKEMDIYEYTLKKLFSPEIAEKRLLRIQDPEKKTWIIQTLGRIQLLREDIRG